MAYYQEKMVIITGFLGINGNDTGIGNLWLTMAMEESMMADYQPIIMDND